MQDRYVGDIGDFGKIALLRYIHEQGLSVAVNWYLAEPPASEKDADGIFKQEDGKYLIPENLRVCDEALAERLTKIAKSSNRSIQSLERARLLPGAKYYHEIVPVYGREEWHKKALIALKSADVVFLDPDNGLLVKSVGKKSARSVKYTFYEEVEAYLKQGQSVIVYNHRCRKPEEKYFQDICENLQMHVGIPESKILKITFPKCSVRDYFAIPVSQAHSDKVLVAFQMMENSLWGQSGMCKIHQ